MNTNTKFLWKEVLLIGLLASAVSDAVQLHRLQHPSRDTKWYNGEVLVSVNINGTNHNAKLNNIELGLREDGVVVFRTNTTLQQVRPQQP